MHDSHRQGQLYFARPSCLRSTMHFIVTSSNGMRCRWCICLELSRSLLGKSPPHPPNSLIISNLKILSFHHQSPTPIPCCAASQALQTKNTDLSCSSWWCLKWAGSFVSLHQSSYSNAANTQPARDSAEQPRASWIDSATRPFNVLSTTVLHLQLFLSLIPGVIGHSTFKNLTTQKICSCYDVRRRIRRVGWQEKIDKSCYRFGWYLRWEVGRVMWWHLMR